MKNSAILLVQCPDRKGLNATIAEFIYRYDGNILHFEQHQAGEERFYLARVEWDLSGFRTSPAVQTARSTEGTDLRVVLRPRRRGCWPRMKVLAAPDAETFVREHGGRLYVWTDRTRCCEPAI